MALVWLEELKSAAGRQAVLAEHGPHLVVGVLGILLAIQAGFLVTAQNTGGSALNALPTPASSYAPGARARRGNALNLDAIVNAHLFGEAHTATASDAPQTAVPLVLAGVLAVPDPSKGMAILGATTAAAKLYAVGSSVPGGVRLHAVYPDRVLLDRAGVIESLLLPTKLTSAALAPISSGPSPAQRLAALAQVSGGGLLGGLIRAQPVFAGGKVSGYRIFPGGRASVAAFTQLGLRAGDMVTAVNGTPLDDANRANEILQTLNSADSANLTVLRNGQSQDINLNLQSVASEAESAAAQGAAAERRGGAFGGPPNNAGGFPGMRGSMIAPVPQDGANTASPLPETPATTPGEQ